MQLHEYMLYYGFEIVPDDNGTFMVTVVELPEVTTFGKTVIEALDNARNAIDEAIAAKASEQTALIR
jgi:antitoxin HicB